MRRWKEKKDAAGETMNNKYVFWALSGMSHVNRAPMKRLKTFIFLRLFMITRNYGIISLIIYVYLF